MLLKCVKAGKGKALKSGLLILFSNLALKERWGALTSLGFAPKWEEPPLREGSWDHAVLLWFPFSKLLQAALNCNKRHFQPGWMQILTVEGKSLSSCCRDKPGVFAYVISFNYHNPVKDIVEALTRKRRQREVKEPVRNYTAKKWGSWA